MAKKLMLFVAMTMFVVASPVLAYDHGASHKSMENNALQGSMAEQNTKESEMLLKNCAKQVAIIQQHIKRLETEIKEKRAGISTRDELKKLEQALKESNKIVRALQLM